MKQEFIFHGSLETIDPDVSELIRREEERQRNTIILIASESESPQAVQEATANVFSHVYAEGYPSDHSRRQTQAEIMDIDYEVANYRRNSDPRFYKGVEYADVLESLTRRRAAELFAANGVSADDLYVNVQPLSGSPANSAVYTALLQPGDTILGLKLSDGGHLSHGAPVSRSGQIYKSVSYIVDSALQAINYDAVEALAIQCKPRIIVAGFSAYPLIIDWQRFRAIADKVGAYLLADIAHISGLVASGVHPSPIGIADVVSTTTHKSLCGPRGAMIMTHRADFAPKIDKAVFPGEQGGPHLNTISALAVALKLAATDQFRDLQRQIARNAARMAERFQTVHGLIVPFGKTENHLLMVDCRSIRVDGVPLTGDVASRILDVAGIVVNRNNVPADKSAMNPFGIRIGTVWMTQRGFGDEETDLLTDAIAMILKGCTPYFYRDSGGKEFRAKIDPSALYEARRIVAQLTGAVKTIDPEQKTVSIRGEKSAEFLNYALASIPHALNIGEAHPSYLHAYPLGMDAILEKKADDLYYLHVADAESAALARQWLADLSDGYIAFGELHAKLPGPIVAKTVAVAQPTAINSSDPISNTKPFFVGQKSAEQAENLPAFAWSPSADEGTLKRTPLYETHVASGGKMVPFGGYDMPIWYASVSEEHAAVRKAAGLFDVSHMGVFEVSGNGSAEFINIVTSNNGNALDVGESQYAFLFAPDGRVIDDLIIYCLAPEKYLLVVNASNNDEDWAWLTAINEQRVAIDSARPWIKLQTPVTLRDLRNPINGADQRVDIALQGPKSVEILLALGADEITAAQLRGLAWAHVMQATLGGFDLIVSRTGYTGERVGYELFVHPDRSAELWQKLLEVGTSLGLKPCGLASRDSTRTEAGLPLHGHELAGKFNLNPFEAGFSKYVKLYKPFFIGRSAMLTVHNNDPERTLVRFRMNDKGVRRPEHGDPILDKRGQVIGHVTSCAIDSTGYLLGLAIVPYELRKAGTVLSIYQTGGGSRSLTLPENADLGSRFPLPDNATVLSRFP